MFGVSKLVIVAMTASLLTGGAMVALTGAGPLGGSDYGLDTDGDGAYDWLVVKMTFRADAAEYYTVWATLGTATPFGRGCFGWMPPPILGGDGRNGSTDATYPIPTEKDPAYPISWASVREFLEPGEHTIALAFRGTDIGMAGVDGPYVVQAQVFADGQWGDPTGQRGAPLPMPEGWTWEYTTGAYDADDFEEPRWAIRFTGVHEDRGLDLDGDGLFEYLALQADVQVNLAGTYSYDAYVSSFDGSRPDVWGFGTFDYGTVDLVEGLQTIEARFNGGDLWASGRNGAFDFTFNVYYGGGWIGGGQIREGEPYPPGPGETGFDAYGDSLCGKTSEYAHEQWEERVEPASFTGVFRDFGEDLDGDGLFDHLVVEAEVNVTEANTFDFYGQLTSEDGPMWISAAYEQMYLEVGVQTIGLRFAGPDIRRSGIDGPYRADLNLVVAMRDPQATIITGTYAHTDFEEDETTTRGSLWIADLSADASEIRTTVERGPDLLTVVMDGTVRVQAFAADGTLAFEGNGTVSLPSGGDVVTVTFAWSPDPGTYVIVAMLDSQWGTDAVKVAVTV